MTTTAHESSIVGTYDSLGEATAAVKVLARAGIAGKQLAIVGRDAAGRACIFDLVAWTDRMVAWGRSGALWGALGGALLGGAFFFHTPIEALLAEGSLIGALERAVGGAMAGAIGGSLAAAWTSLRVPAETFVHEHTGEPGTFLIVTREPADFVEQARAALRMQHAVVPTNIAWPT